MTITEKLLDLIFPRQCGICGKLGSFLCDKCYNELKKYEIENQHKNIFFVYRYEGKIRDLIIDYKFNDKAYLYKTFAENLLKNKKLCKFLYSYDIILSVPLHKKRYLERGYNQSDLIAKEIAKKLNIMYDSKVLIKKVNIKPQSTQRINERKTNVKGIFEVNNKERIINKKVLIFDDIYTTGSTANECKEVLLKSGAKQVGILALAKDYIN